jgi:hypothetical protein
MKHQTETLASIMMLCPECLEEAPPLPGSSLILAWYICPQCDHFWSARIRDGRPVAEIPIDTSGLTSH